LILALFTFDAVLTFILYMWRGETTASDSRSHLYQRLVQLGDPPARVTRLYLLLSAGFGIAGLVYWREVAVIALLCVGLICFALLLWIMRREAETTSPVIERVEHAESMEQWAEVP
jgi:hypothetical protein